MNKVKIIISAAILSSCNCAAQIKLSGLPRAAVVDTESYFVGTEYTGTSYIDYLFPFNRMVSALRDSFPGGGSVISVTAGMGLTGGTITSSGTISLPDVGIPGSVGGSGEIPVISFDEQGRETSYTTVPVAAGGSPGGWNNSIQYNETGALTGNGDLTYWPGSQIFSVGWGGQSDLGVYFQYAYLGNVGSSNYIEVDSLGKQVIMQTGDSCIIRATDTIHAYTQDVKIDYLSAGGLMSDSSGNIYSAGLLPGTIVAQSYYPALILLL